MTAVARTRAAMRRPRGQVPASAGAGAPAAAFPAPTRGRSAAPPRTRAPLLFLSLSPTLTRGISSSCTRGGWRLADAPDCYLLPSPVTSRVTANPLFLHGLRGVLLCYRPRCPLDACTGAPTRALFSLSSLGNIGNRDIYLYVPTAWALPATLPGAVEAGNRVTFSAVASAPLSGRNKIGGGYSPRPGEGAAQGRPAGDGREKFWGFARSVCAGAVAQLSGLVAAIGPDDEEDEGVNDLGELLEAGGAGGIQRAGGNGGKLRFFVGTSATVGRVALEGSRQADEKAGDFLACRKLPRLPRCRAARRLAAELAAADRRQHGREGEPFRRGRPPPPFAPSPLPRSLALDAFGIWIEPREDGLAAPETPDRIFGVALPSRFGPGSGVISPTRAASAAGRRARGAKTGKRVGDDPSSVLRGKREASARLARGGAGVN